MNLFTSTLAGIYRKAGMFIFIAAAVFLLISCSSSRNEDNDSGFSDNEKEKNYVFTDDGIEWKVKLSDDEITELYKDGGRVSDSDIHLYKDMINKKIARFEEDMEEFQANMEEFHKDMNNYNSEMAEMRQEMQKHQYSFDFNTDQFEKDMEKVATEMSVAFASTGFQEGMNAITESLKDLHVNINMDEVNEELREAAEELEDINVDIDLSSLNDEMADLEEELKDMKVELNGAKKSIKKFNIFMDDLKYELEDDGLIKDADDDFDMIFNSEEIIINGEKAPDELHRKYKRMYEDRFGIMDDEMNIRTNE
jgi:chromosome segregation ATPase